MRTTNKLTIAALTFAAVAVISAQTVVTTGLKTPRLNTVERNTIQTSGNPYAKGQVIYNTDNDFLEYWNGTRWVADRDSIVGNEVTDAADATLTRSGAGTALSPYKLKANTAAIGDSLLANNTFITNLGDTLLNNNHFVTNVIDTLKSYLEDTNTLYTAGDGLKLTGTEFSANYKVIADSIAANYFKSGDALYDSIAIMIGNVSTGVTAVNVTANGLVQTGTSANVTLALPAGTTSGQVLKYNGTKWEAGADNDTKYQAGTGLTLSGTTFSLDPAAVGAQIRDSLANVINTKVDTIANRGGLTIDKSDNKNYKLGLIPGTAADQILKWNAGTSKWELATAQSVIKKITVTLTTLNNFTVESVGYAGTTGTSANNIEVIGIKPVITSPSGDAFIIDYLTVSATAKVVSNAIAYAVKIQNANMLGTQNYTVGSIDIYYTCSDTLAAGAAPAVRTYTGW
ncbi:hypothetical protein FACS18945_5220 [Bacteroidia bacterium]|nr:hypothetical protein FACS18945_5220 [Bacteroidia bacterium]